MADVLLPKGVRMVFTAGAFGQAAALLGTELLQGHLSQLAPDLIVHVDCLGVIPSGVRENLINSDRHLRSTPAVNALKTAVRKGLQESTKLRQAFRNRFSLTSGMDAMATQKGAAYLENVIIRGNILGEMARQSQKTEQPEAPILTRLAGQLPTSFEIESDPLVARPGYACYLRIASDAPDGTEAILIDKSGVFENPPLRVTFQAGRVKIRLDASMTAVAPTTDEAKLSMVLEVKMECDRVGTVGHTVPVQIAGKAPEPKRNGGKTRISMGPLKVTPIPVYENWDEDQKDIITAPFVDTRNNGQATSTHLVFKVNMQHPLLMQGFASRGWAPDSKHRRFMLWKFYGLICSFTFHAFVTLKAQENAEQSEVVRELAKAVLRAFVGIECPDKVKVSDIQKGIDDLFVAKAEDDAPEDAPALGDSVEAPAPEDTEN